MAKQKTKQPKKVPFQVGDLVTGEHFLTSKVLFGVVVDIESDGDLCLAFYSGNVDQNTGCIIKASTAEHWVSTKHSYLPIETGSKLIGKNRSTNKVLYGEFTGGTYTYEGVEFYRLKGGNTSDSVYLIANPMPCFYNETETDNNGRKQVPVGVPIYTGRNGEMLFKVGDLVVGKHFVTGKKLYGVVGGICADGDVMLQLGTGNACFDNGHILELESVEHWDMDKHLKDVPLEAGATYIGFNKRSGKLLYGELMNTEPSVDNADLKHYRLENGNTDGCRTYLALNIMPSPKANEYKLSLLSDSFFGQDKERNMPKEEEPKPTNGNSMFKRGDLVIGKHKSTGEELYGVVGLVTDVGDIGLLPYTGNSTSTSFILDSKTAEHWDMNKHLKRPPLKGATFLGYHKTQQKILFGVLDENEPWEEHGNAHYTLEGGNTKSYTYLATNLMPSPHIEKAQLNSFFFGQDEEEDSGEQEVPTPKEEGPSEEKPKATRRKAPAIPPTPTSDDDEPWNTPMPALVSIIKFHETLHYTKPQGGNIPFIGIDSKANEGRLDIVNTRCSSRAIQGWLFDMLMNVADHLNDEVDWLPEEGDVRFYPCVIEGRVGALRMEYNFLPMPSFKTEHLAMRAFSFFNQEQIQYLFGSKIIRD